MFWSYAKYLACMADCIGNVPFVVATISPYTYVIVLNLSWNTIYRWISFVMSSMAIASSRAGVDYILGEFKFTLYDQFGLSVLFSCFLCFISVVSIDFYWSSVFSRTILSVKLFSVQLFFNSSSQPNSSLNKGSDPNDYLPQMFLRLYTCQWHASILKLGNLVSRLIYSTAWLWNTTPIAT